MKIFTSILYMGLRVSSLSCRWDSKIQWRKSSTRLWTWWQV